MNELFIFETSGAWIIWNFEVREFNRGRELLLNLFSENARIIRNPWVRELIETTCANYLNFTWRCMDWLKLYMRELFEFDCTNKIWYTLLFLVEIKFLKNHIFSCLLLLLLDMDCYSSSSSESSSNVVSRLNPSGTCLSWTAISTTSSFSSSCSKSASRFAS